MNPYLDKLYNSIRYGCFTESSQILNYITCLKNKQILFYITCLKNKQKTGYIIETLIANQNNCGGRLSSDFLGM